jgi:S-adenosylmethionine:tRNA ribosyltransferase-isomerase
MTLAPPRTTFAPGADSTASLPVEDRGLRRDDVRLLVARPDGVTHTRFSRLAEHLDPGDLLVVNTSATVAAQVDAKTAGGGARVLHLATQVSATQWVVEVRSAPDAARAVLDHEPGDVIRAGRSRVTLLEPYAGRPASPTSAGNRLWLARVDSPTALARLLRRRGRPIAYGYLDHRLPLTAYQTIFAREPGSAEMPSAARPFTHEVLVDIVARGVRVAPVTLHTGVSSQEGGEPPQAERFAVPASTAEIVEVTRAEGGRVVAVGTTVTRALESAVEEGRVVAASGWTDLVLGPEHRPRLVTGLVTGLHDPHASHLHLVESVAGPELTQAAYDAAVAEGYLWHEFGDSCLFLP